jgi:endoribonuclease Dicer
MAGSKGKRTVMNTYHYYETLKCLVTYQAAEVLQSYKESRLSFWGEKLDEQVEGFVRNYAKDVYNDLSETILKMAKRGIQRNCIFLPFSC